MGAPAGEGAPEQRLEALVRAHLRYNVEYPRESRIIIEESRFLNEVDLAATRERQMAILNAYRACVRQVMASGRLGDADLSLATFGITSLFGSWYRWYREGGPVPKEQAFARVRVVWCRSVGTVSAPAALNIDVQDCSRLFRLC